MHRQVYTVVAAGVRGKTAMIALVMGMGTGLTTCGAAGQGREGEAGKPTERARSLLTMARERYGSMTQAEQAILIAAANGSRTR